MDIKEQIKLELYHKYTEMKKKYKQTATLSEKMVIYFVNQYECGDILDMRMFYYVRYMNFDGDCRDFDKYIADVIYDNSKKINKNL